MITTPVIGRGTLQKVLDFPAWPYDKKVFVLSNSMKQVPEKLKNNMTLLAMEPAALLDYLRQKGFSGIYIDGGKVIQAFLQADLIDELIVSKVPVLIGSGIPLFGFLENDLNFEHIRTGTYSNGLVRSYYLRKRNLTN